MTTPSPESEVVADDQAQSDSSVIEALERFTHHIETNGMCIWRGSWASDADRPALEDLEVLLNYVRNSAGR